MAADTDMTEGAPPNAETSDRRRIGWLVLAVILAIIIWWLLHSIGRVPNTVGMTEKRARTLIEAAGFDMAATKATVPAAQVGRVVMQAPARGWRFTWWPVNVAVGMAWREPTASESEPSTELPPQVGSLETGFVESSATAEVMPEDAEEMDPLYRPAPANVGLMPNVQNMSEAKATQALRLAGFRFTISRGPSTTGVSKGRIFFQDPAPWTRLKAGAVVELWVSEGYDGLMGWGSYPRPGHP